MFCSLLFATPGLYVVVAVPHISLVTITGLNNCEYNCKLFLSEKKNVGYYISSEQNIATQ